MSFPALRTRFEALPPNIRGAIWMTLSTAVFITMQAIGKYLGDEIHSFEVTFFRMLFAVFATLPFVLGNGLENFRTQRFPLHLLRGLLGAGASFCAFFAVMHIPLADATTISFTRPLFMILVAVFLLGEIVRIRRWTATVVGFGGVVIMTRPGFGGAVDIGAGAALLSALLFCLAHVCVKRLTATESSRTILVWNVIIATVVLLPPTLYVWVTPDPVQLGLLMLVGALGAVAQTCVIQSLRAADATVVEPFDYTRLIFAVAIGWAVFGNFPSEWVFVGAAVIIGANLYIGRRAAHERTSPVPGGARGAVDAVDKDRAIPAPGKKDD